MTISKLLEAALRPVLSLRSGDGALSLRVGSRVFSASDALGDSETPPDDPRPWWRGEKGLARYGRAFRIGDLRIATFSLAGREEARVRANPEKHAVPPKVANRFATGKSCDPFVYRKDLGSDVLRRVGPRDVASWRIFREEKGGAERIVLELRCFVMRATEAATVLPELQARFTGDYSGSTPIWDREIFAGVATRDSTGGRRDLVLKDAEFRTMDARCTGYVDPVELIYEFVGSGVEWRDPSWREAPTSRPDREGVAVVPDRASDVFRAGDIVGNADDLAREIRDAREGGEKERRELAEEIVRDAGLSSLEKAVFFATAWVDTALMFARGEKCWRDRATAEERRVAQAILSEHKACAEIAERCSGGDETISKRDLIASRIRDRPVPVASPQETDPFAGWSKEEFDRATLADEASGRAEELRRARARAERRADYERKKPDPDRSFMLRGLPDHAETDGFLTEEDARRATEHGYDVP